MLKGASLRRGALILLLAGLAGFAEGREGGPAHRSQVRRTREERGRDPFQKPAAGPDTPRPPGLAGIGIMEAVVRGIVRYQDPSGGEEETGAFGCAILESRSGGGIRCHSGRSSPGTEFWGEIVDGGVIFWLEGDPHRPVHRPLAAPGADPRRSDEKFDEALGIAAAVRFRARGPRGPGRAPGFRRWRSNDAGSGRRISTGGNRVTGSSGGGRNQSPLSSQTEVARACGRAVAGRVPGADAGGGSFGGGWVLGNWNARNPRVRVSADETEGITVEAAPGVVCDPSLFEAGLEILCRAPPEPASESGESGADGEIPRGVAGAAEPRVSLDFRTRISGTCSVC